MARPSPREAPVTSAVFPFNRAAMGSPLQIGAVNDSGCFSLRRRSRFDSQASARANSKDTFASAALLLQALLQLLELAAQLRQLGGRWSGRGLRGGALGARGRPHAEHPRESAGEGRSEKGIERRHRLRALLRLEIDLERPG